MTGTSARMLALLSLLQARRDWPGQVLAERLDVTPRTVRRDVDRLRELGYRVAASKGPYGGYRLEAGSELPPLLFDEGQAVAVAVALQNAAAGGVDVAEDAERALATVRQVMPSRLRHRMDGIRFLETAAEHRVDPGVLEAASAAVRDQEVLRFDYGDAADRPPRRAEPHAVVAREGRWYLLAWDLDAHDWRTYRLDRMKPRVPRGPRFAPRPLPADDARTYLAARAKGSTTEDRWPCVGMVVLERDAREVAPWAGSGDLEPLPDGSCRLTVGSWSWTGVLAAVARFDAPFTIIGPEALREAAVALANRVHAAAAATR
ncbi:helix-turn-helix transcriptional regulator [Zhihengliuella sp. ISTPL4]|uniref:helix-turn-helix transcriptional regulator n=1 Tax=Zhihengliuella sp. ISTPL4 TaxID=2058657 RepID=UPI000C7A38B1|nr:WYL domain-containing protein [Zhihengliuella sp. ISTPL4]